MTDNEMYFRKANFDDVEQIWDILQQAIERRKQEGSKQWQEGYPNVEIVKNDIAKQQGYVLENGIVNAYFVVIKNNEPTYEVIQGEWLTNGDFVVVHRVAVRDEYLNKGLAIKIFEYIETLAINEHIYSIKVDTNFDNFQMLRLLEKLDYIYCGEIFFNGNTRKAFEKVLNK